VLRKSNKNVSRSINILQRYKVTKIAHRQDKIKIKHTLIHDQMHFLAPSFLNSYKQYVSACLFLKLWTKVNEDTMLCKFFFQSSCKIMLNTGQN
jgi:hypothetical protein